MTKRFFYFVDLSERGYFVVASRVSCDGQVEYTKRAICGAVERGVAARVSVCWSRTHARTRDPTSSVGRRNLCRALTRD